ncbi:hypothetical protein DL763_000978 [Monosporascus cannonballus]|nr:hypothetical protein DL763_000978 [Monosporascus cannonballus]
MKLARYAAYTADVRAFRKKFTTKSGRPGTSLLNEQQRRNNKSKNNFKAGSAEPDRRGHSTEEPIDVNTLETGPAIDTLSYAFPYPRSAGASSRPDNTRQNPATQDYGSNEHRKTLDDIYDLPDGTGSEQAMGGYAPGKYLTTE